MFKGQVNLLFVVLNDTGVTFEHIDLIPFFILIPETQVTNFGFIPARDRGETL